VRVEAFRVLGVWVGVETALCEYGFSLSLEREREREREKGLSLSRGRERESAREIGR
jgi:hypothetical protein